MSLRVGRLQLSTRNNYKINGKNAKRCFILNEKNDNNLILINTSKEYESSDKYILFDNITKTIINIYGNVGNVLDDKNIYYHLFTYNWLSHKKYLQLFNFILSNDYDICEKRIIYEKEIITVDPPESLDLDDGFFIDEDEENYYLDIHIADPISYFDLSHEGVKAIFDELMIRLNTCYIKINNLLPEEFVKKVTLIGQNKRTILFKTIINKNNHQINFQIHKTIVTTKINNFSYQNFDILLSNKLSFKNNLITISNILINNMYNGDNHQNNPFETLSHEDDISHKFIEIIMIWTNFQTGNILAKSFPKSIIRIQNMSQEINFIKISDLTLYNSIKNILKISASYEFSSHENNLHHSLNLKYYSHVSSPMRRFVDMYNHLLIHNQTHFIENYILQKFNLEYLNHTVKIQKRLSNAFFLMNFILNNPDTIFQAMIIKIKNYNDTNNDFTNNTNNKIVSIVIYNITINFKKIFIMKIPFNDNIKLFTPFNVKLCYNSSLFKNYIFPFSICIL